MTTYTPVVHHNPDNMVIIRSTSQVYVDTLANFQSDFATTMPAMPAGANDRVYEPGIRHPIMGGGNIIADGGVPWPFGDNLITNIQTGLTAQAGRPPLPNPPPTTIP